MTASETNVASMITICGNRGAPGVKNNGKNATKNTMLFGLSAVTEKACQNIFAS